MEPLYVITLDIDGCAEYDKLSMARLCQAYKFLAVVSSNTLFYWHDWPLTGVAIHVNFHPSDYIRANEGKWKGWSFSCTWGPLVFVPRALSFLTHMIVSRLISQSEADLIIGEVADACWSVGSPTDQIASGIAKEREREREAWKETIKFNNLISFFY